MIRFSEVSKCFGTTTAVDHITFEANEKEILVLLGPSGCGKTTTLKMINRLVEPDSGSIFIGERDIRVQKKEELRKEIGFVMQQAGLFPHYSIEKNIAVVPNLLNWDKKQIRSKTIELMAKLQLDEDLLLRFPHELSGGQQQRVGIARALIANSPILLMDEPFGALDNITKTEIHSEFKSLEELKNKTIILVTHDIKEAFTLGHRICLMDKGKIVQIGTPEEMLYHPINNFVRDFFASNRLLLEYTITSIKDIMPFLNDQGQMHRKSIAADTSVLEALQVFSTENQTTATYDALSSAFNAYRKQKLS